MDVILKRIAAVSAVLLWVGPTVAAEDRTESTISMVASYVVRLEQVEAELAALKTQADNGCATDSCDSCERCCEDPPHGVYAGFAFVFARPHFTNGINYQETVVDGEGNALGEARQFSYQHELTPRVWLGYVGRSGLGLRARYWQFDHDGDPVDLAIPLGSPRELSAFIGAAWGERDIAAGAGDTFHVDNSLEVHAIDFELTQRIDFWLASATLGAGVRYGYLRQQLRAWVLPDEAFLAESEVFEGLGPTVSIELHRPIGSRGLALFAAARGSVLFGGSDLIAGEIEEGVQNLFLHHGDRPLGVGEAEIGLEWSRELTAGGSLFFRAGYEGQLWHEAGSPSFRIGDLGFEGFSLALGLNR